MHLAMFCPSPPQRKKGVTASDSGSAGAGPSHLTNNGGWGLWFLAFVRSAVQQLVFGCFWVRIWYQDSWHTVAAFFFFIFLLFMIICNSIVLSLSLSLSMNCMKVFRMTCSPTFSTKERSIAEVIGFVAWTGAHFICLPVPSTIRLPLMNAT